MTRFEINEGHIRIAYGSEDLWINNITYFLSVIDKRIAYESGYDDDGEPYDDDCEPLKVIEEIDISQGGNYFALNTGLGIGRRVSKETMVHFLKLYGVPEKHWKVVAKGQEMT